MTEKSKGLWKTDMKTATAVKAIAAALLTGLAAGGVVDTPIAQGVASILQVLFG